MTSSSSIAQLVGPLPTVFEPPAECFSLAYQTEYPEVAYLAQSCFGGALSNEGRCLPGAPTVFSAAPWYHVYYSPGAACPTGYTTACMATNEQEKGSQTLPAAAFNFEFPPTPGETAVGCCPTQYSYSCSGGIQTCVSGVATATLTGYTCDNNAIVPARFQIPTTVGTVTASSMSIYAPMIQFMYKAGHTVTVTETPTGASQKSGGLDTGDDAALGVGVVAAALLIVAAVLGWLLIRRRRAAGRDTSADREQHWLVNRLNGREKTEELTGNGLNEMEHPFPELPDRRH